MQIYEQGEEYAEEEFEEDVESEGEEDTESKITSIYGIPIKTVAIVGAGVLVLVLVLVLFATRRSGGSSTDEDVALDPTVFDQTDAGTDFIDVSEIPTDTSTDTGTSTSGEMVYNPDTGLWESADAGDTQDVTIESATDEERLKLRAMGYTGDEIDYCLNNGFSVQALIDAAQELYDKEAEEALVRMSDSASEEFRYIIDNTYFSQQGWEFEPLKDKQFGTYDYEQGSYTVNADYVKCPTYGAQLQLKCRVAQDLWVWYIVTPERFEALPSEGNIVLRVNYTKYGVNTYVTAVVETDPTLDTIDSSEISSEDIGDGAVTDTASEVSEDTGDVVSEE